ncbi:DNA-binding response regulator, OmpR family, contains REC and winged-helix (wHTH) domain [Malonomonas rubra DSM 5091]|uniref:Phosphate regulon transcriptional regulatory protein PhoB n=1 Tax=Malonomonas rubra DSM 5091 TaxID=1122189 RepID=A0A1M6EX43_MALRU|nr:response regulator transcription factor [Malonomonas rubra]SHI90002.1 DNA-binding response regulator, OmpR family, contains REC and winged-helix (wHTH) domain [Malonomonas rubra DSM 5091]
MAEISILLAEDDTDLRLGLIDLLELEGYRVLPCVDGTEALACYQREKPTLLLLDVMMPGKSGYDLCREIRKRDSQTPIILITAKGEEIDKVVGLELGADDYITKPFGLHELRARIAAMLRRVRPAQREESAELSDEIELAGIRIDRKNYCLHKGRGTVALTPREMNLLDAFLQHPNQVLSRNDLLNAAWGVDYFGTTRTLDQHIAQLRKKIESDPACPKIIQTVHGVGYRLGKIETE